ncbi:MAG TPA: GerAB/ArcD/ProY family transporter [Bacillota bacterium]|jgi:hypothetical protein
MKLLVTLGHREFFSLSFIGVVCANLVFMPSAFVDAGGRMAWVMPFLALAVDLVASLVVVSLAVRLRDHELIELAVNKGGWLGRIGIAGMTVLTLASLVLDTRFNLLLFSGTLLIRTPEIIASSLPMLAALGLTFSGAVRMGRLAPWVLVLLMASILFALVLSWHRMDLGYLLPLWDPQNVHLGDLAFTASLGGIRAGWVTALLVVHCDKKVKPIRTMLLAKAVGGSAIVFSILQPLAMLGFGGANETTTPFLYTITTLAVYSFPVERLEFFLRLILSIQVSFSMALDVWAGTLGVWAFFRKPSFAVMATIFSATALLASGLIRTSNELRLITFWIASLNLLSLPLFGLLWLALRGMLRPSGKVAAGARS